eukprot:7068_1
MSILKQSVISEIKKQLTHGYLEDYPVIGAFQQGGRWSNKNFGKAKQTIKENDKFTTICAHSICAATWKDRNRYNQWKRKHFYGCNNACVGLPVTFIVTSWFSTQQVPNEQYIEPENREPSENNPRRRNKKKKKTPIEHVQFLESYDTEYRLVDMDDVTIRMKPIA